MSRFLIATWDGAGNLVPTPGRARRLCRAGHDVRVLGHPSIDDRCGNHGWRFRAFERTPDVDSIAVHDRAGQLSAGQALDVPTVALFHGVFAFFRGGPLADA